MSHSQRVSVSDVACMLQLVGELEELAPDGLLRQRHFCDALARQLGAKLVTYCEVFLPGAGSPPVYKAWTTGGLATEDKHRHLASWSHEECGKELFERFLPLCKQNFSKRRAEAVEARDRRRAPHICQWLRVVRRDHRLYGATGVDGNRIVAGIGAYRETGERPFQWREQALIHLLTGALPRLRRLLVKQPDVPSSAGDGANGPLHDVLPPRLRLVLAQLLGGFAEKQVATRLGLSRHTVHGYVKELYRCFCVGSRAELLAHFIKQSTPCAKRSPPAEFGQNRGTCVKLRTSRPGADHVPESPSDTRPTTRLTVPTR